MYSNTVRPVLVPGSSMEPGDPLRRHTGRGRGLKSVWPRSNDQSRLLADRGESKEARQGVFGLGFVLRPEWSPGHLNYILVPLYARGSSLILYSSTSIPDKPLVSQPSSHPNGKRTCPRMRS
jgi:hypothetical protein